MARWYDFGTDTFVTDRPTIIDKVVITAAALLTYASRSGESAGLIVSPEAEALLAKALKGDDRDRYAVQHMARTLWRAWALEPEVA